MYTYKPGPSIFLYIYVYIPFCTGLVYIAVLYMYLCLPYPGMQALHGPFQYPEGLRPVSPVFWICVRNKAHSMHFLKPLSITLQHCLHVDSEEEIESLGLTFLKGDHEMSLEGKYQFHIAEGRSTFKANNDRGTLQTDHFCYKCIACKISDSALQRAKFCLYGTVPRTFVYDKLMYIVFFATFLLETCLETVHRQIMNMPEIEEYEYILCPCNE